MQKYDKFVEKESHKSSLKIKIIKKLEIITIFQVIVEAQHIVYVILKVMRQVKSL